MKKYFIAVMMAMDIAANMSASAEVVREGNTFVAQKSETKKGESIATAYEYETGGKKYTIMLSASGRAYIIKTSAKTGNEYKQYLGEEISRTICSELGKEYKEKSK